MVVPTPSLIMTSGLALSPLMLVERSGASVTRHARTSTAITAGPGEGFEDVLTAESEGRSLIDIVFEALKSCHICRAMWSY